MAPDSAARMTGTPSPLEARLTGSFASRMLQELFGRSGDGLGLDFVAGVLWPLVLVWVAVIVIMVAGVQKGIGATSVVFIPLLVVAFLAVTHRYKSGIVVDLVILGDALELRHRLPMTWDRIVKGDLAAWKARRIARQTTGLTREAGL